jgi:Mechanosensitive ion channel, conserved TM helix
MADMIVERLTQTLGRFVAVAIDFVPRLLALVIIIFLGWCIAFAARWVIRRIVALLKFESFSEKSGVTQTLTRVGLPPPGEFVARVVFWVLLFSFMVLGLSVLGIATLEQEISRFFQFVPHVFVALLILYVGFWAAHFFSRTALLAAVNANFPLPRLVASFVQLTIAILAVTMAFEQLGLARTAVLIAFSITFGSIMIGLAIAFGLGGQNAARRLLEKQLMEKASGKEKDEEVSPL